MSYILGISSFFHDSAAALLHNGQIVAAAQEERFTRIKHDSSFPKNSIDYCLKEASITPSDLNLVAYYEKPLLKFERLLSSYLHESPKGFCSFIKAMPLWIQQKFFVEREIDHALKNYNGPISYCTHHQSHAASAFFPSPFEEAAIITFDGVGEWSTTTWGVGKMNSISLNNEIQFPHSLGLLYSAFTYFTGFKVNSGEYKLMGLAPYGEPKYVQTILENLIDIKEDGSFNLNLNYFNFISGLTMTSHKFAQLFERPPRIPESPITQSDMDLAASIQVVTEQAMLKIANHVYRETQLESLCLAGGVALNCVGNGNILRNSPFKNIWIQPAAGDAGGALGSALFAWYQHKQQPRVPAPRDSQKGSLLGPSYSNDEIKQYLNSIKAKYSYLDDSQLFTYLSQLLANEKVVGFFQGRMEFGPRALGARSILGDARSDKMQKQMNLKIKFRESFRPFAPSCLEEDVSHYFELNTPSPYMLLVSQINSKRRNNDIDHDSIQGLDKLKQRRSDIPAVTHVDYSARVQTVSPDKNLKFYNLLKAFKELTGESVLINTSFNVRGEPIVMNPQDAFYCFMNTDMDVLVLENYICLKEEQSETIIDTNKQHIFNLD